MQFAERYSFDVTFKVAKLKGEALSQSLTPAGSAVECLLKARPSHGSQCDLLLVCRLGELSFAYVDAQLDASAECRGLMRRFDCDTCEQQLCQLPLPTIGKNSHFLATNMKVSGRLVVEAGCGPHHFQPDGFSDVSFLVGDCELHLHRSLLAKASPVFRAMLLGDFLEASDAKQQIQLPGKSLSTFVELLATLYPPQLEIHHGRAKTLLALFAEYQMDHMLLKCERALLQSPLYSQAEDLGDPEAGLPQPWMEELMDHAFLASVYHLQELQAKAVTLLANVRTGEYQKAMKELLPDDLLCQVFAKRVEVLEATIERLSIELESCRQAGSEA